MSSRRRPFVLLILALLLAAACSSPRNPVGDVPRRPNLLIFTFDTTRADRLSVYGGTQAQVPNLERLAAGGVRFDAAFAPTPITLPSHVSLFTGLYPTRRPVCGDHRL